jgi:hypothetical protein
MALALGLFLALGAPARALTSWEPKEEARLAKGDAVARVSDEKGPGGRVLAAIDIPVKADIVWRVMLDCARAPEYVPRLQSCAIVESGADGLSDVRDHTIRWIAILPTVKLRFRSDYEPGRVIRVSRISGDLAAMQGAWVLESRDGGRTTRLHYDFRMAPKTPVPKGLVRSAMLQDAPKVLKTVRAEALRVAAQ